jgi:hypothetical protein
MSSLSDLMSVGERVLLVGPPGCGKTARIQAAATAAGRRLVTMRASLSERVDFGGALVPDLESGTTRTLPLEVLRDLQTTTEPTLLFLDDLGQAPVDVQAALMRLFDAGSLSSQVLIWGATNRPGDAAGVTRLCEPLRSRFALAFIVPTPGTTSAATGGVPLGTWQSEVDAWTDWALDEGAAPEVIAWHRSTTGRTLYQWQPSADPSVRMADYRSWYAVMRLWGAGLRDLETLAAAIGRPVAAEFLAFARLADQLPTPDQVWMDPLGAPVPSDSSAQYLICSMLAAAATAPHARQLVQYLARLPRVYGALLGRDAYRRLGARLSGCREWVSWFAANQELFGGPAVAS